MSRPAQFTPEEIKARRNARRVKYQREKMKDPAYRERQKASWRSWYARNKDKVKASVEDWRVANRLRYLFANKRTAAAERGVEWTLKFEDIEWPTHCPALGIELDYGKKGRGGPRDNSPSFDRVFNDHGYVPGNVVVVSQLANRIKTSAGWEQLLKVAEFCKGATEARRPFVKGECLCRTCQSGEFTPFALHGREAVEAYIAGS